MPWAESRATALHGAMAGWGTAEDQLVRIIICSTFKAAFGSCIGCYSVTSGATLGLYRDDGKENGNPRSL